ncbi:helix-turn-helix domain-containing protein [Enterococcus hirae]
MERLKVDKFRIYPTEKQKIFFAKSFGCVRKVYNLMLDDRIKSYEETKT